MNANLENIYSVFEEMRSNGFPITQELKWGFYFVDPEKDNLLRLFDELRSHNYALERLAETHDGLYQLHVSKVEQLSAEKLHRRNIAFNELAEFCNVDLYDGWDVEKLEQLKMITRIAKEEKC